MVVDNQAMYEKGEVAELAEGARLLSEYMPKRCIEGSNPSLSADAWGVSTVIQRS